MKISDAIFCDDIRFEINNKLSLMGIYNDRIIFRIPSMAEIKWPLFTKLSIFLRFKFEREEKHPEKFEFEYFLNSKSILKINDEFKSEESEIHTNLALTAEGIPLEPGHLGFTIKLFEGNNLLFSEENKAAIQIITE